jgi:cysteinyl-tRNA synthetase
MPLQIYNTLLRQKVEFEPADPGHIRMYVCGPTVYDLSHVGHARAYVNFDTIVRYLRRSHKVTYVRNFTDVDDKIIKRAQQTGEAPTLLAARFVDEFEADMAALGCERVDVAPKVTDHIGEIVAMIAELVQKNAAYAVQGDVYYAVEHFENYGKLGRRTLEDMEAGIRVEVAKHKRHPMDFALWKAAKEGEISWDSPWGRGRPGWHIECSAMAKKYLGVTFDIHGGGRDLIFPHHENEIAQSEAVNGATYARLWMHNGLVNIDNAKMSKSVGNFFTIRQVLEKFDAQTMRFYLLSTHYRSPINFSDMALREAETRLKYCNETLQRVHQSLAQDDTPIDATGPLGDEAVAQMLPRFNAAMQDDFNTPQVLAELSPLFKLANELLVSQATKATSSQAQTVNRRTLRVLADNLASMGSVLGVFVEDPAQVLQRIEARRLQKRGLSAAEVERLIGERTAARQGKDFHRADAVRKQLEAMGVVIKDTPAGTVWETV